MRVALTAEDFNGCLPGQRCSSSCLPGQKNHWPAEQDGTAKKLARGLALQVIAKVKSRRKPFWKSNMPCHGNCWTWSGKLSSIVESSTRVAVYNHWLSLKREKRLRRSNIKYWMSQFVQKLIRNAKQKQCIQKTWSLLWQIIGTINWDNLSSVLGKNFLRKVVTSLAWILSKLVNFKAIYRNSTKRGILP